MGVKPSPYKLYETVATLNNFRFFSVNDHAWKTPERIVENRKKLERQGINYLLNVGPDGLGRIPAESVRILKEAEKLFCM